MQHEDRAWCCTSEDARRGQRMVHTCAEQARYCLDSSLRRRLLSPNASSHQQCRAHVGQHRCNRMSGWMTVSRFARGACKLFTEERHGLFRFPVTRARTHSPIALERLPQHRSLSTRTPQKTKKNQKPRSIAFATHLGGLGWAGLVNVLDLVLELLLVRASPEHVVRHSAHHRHHGTPLHNLNPPKHESEEGRFGCACIRKHRGQGRERAGAEAKRGNKRTTTRKRQKRRRMKKKKKREQRESKRQRGG
eukprot:1880572-Rhodomonas_salina.2